MGETIYYFIVYVVEAFIAWQYFDSIFVSKYKKSIEFISFLAGYCILFLISNVDIFWLNTIIFFAVNTILSYVLFCISRKKAGFHAFLMTAIMVITELVIVVVMAWHFSVFAAYKRDMTTLILSTVLCKILYYLCLQIMLRGFFKRKKDDSESGVITILLCIIPLISVWITMTFLFVGFYGTLSMDLTWLVLVSAILMLAINIIIFWIYSYTQKENLKFTRMQLQLQKEKADARYYQMLSEQNENQRILIHDIRKHLSAISGLLDSGSGGQAKEYIDQIVNSPELSNEIHLCDNPTLNLILARYMAVCEKRGIRFETDIRKGCFHFMQMEDITALFSNILENAVEASCGTENAFIELDVRKENAGQILITLINSCEEKPVMSLNGGFVSHKKDLNNHGFGMKSVERTARKYGGNLNAYFDAEERVFHTVIVLDVSKRRK